MPMWFLDFQLQTYDDVMRIVSEPSAVRHKRPNNLRYWNSESAAPNGRGKRERKEIHRENDIVETPTYIGE